ncbi:MAG: hypothetical protein ACLR5S_06880 [Ruminococcus sp.]
MNAFLTTAPTWCFIEIDEKQNIHKYLYKLKETDETFQESYHEYLNHYYLELGQPSLDK